MRLWHKDLIDVLPRQQLLAQWRECCAIARNIATKGTPGHILVNRIMNYPENEFWRYAQRIYMEMRSRGYSCDFSAFSRWYRGVQAPDTDPDELDLFPGWHNKRYLWQCYSNLEEKHDCGGIPEDEWLLIENRMKEVILV